ncbi:MAG: CHAT domain-containing protein [Bacteroidaceae bacterium]|nr:CHAT domain-containing protein [Bacteroidaceae bacterium]
MVLAQVPADTLEVQMERMCDEGDYFGSLHAAEQLMQHYSTAEPPDSTHYIHALSRHAKYLSYLGRLDEALEEGETVRSYHERHTGTQTAEYATALLDLGGYHSRSGHYPEAVKIGEEVLKLRKKLFGTNSVEYAQSLNHLAKYLSYVSQFRRAIQLETEAIEIRSRLCGEDDATYAQMISNLAGYYSRSGNYDKAVEYGERAIEIRSRLLGKHHPDYAQSVNHLARYYSYKGDYYRALSYGNRAVELRREIYGDLHPETAQSLSNLAGYYSRMGNYLAAVKKGREALDIREKIMGHDHPDYAQSVNNLGKYYYFLGDYMKAVEWGQKALELREQSGGRWTRDYAQALSNLADYQDALGNTEEALRLGTLAIVIRDSLLGRQHPDYAESLNSLAAYYYHEGDYAAAVRYGEQAVERNEAILSIGHPTYAQSLSRLALYYDANLQPDSAQSAAIRATDRYTSVILQSFVNMTATERTFYWHTVSHWYLSTLPRLTARHPTQAMIENCYNATLLAKGILLNSEIEMHNLILESGDPQLADRYQRLQQTRRLLSQQFEMPVAKRTLNVDSLFRIVRSEEHLLVQKSKVYGDYTQNLRIDWTAVRDHLQPGELSVEFIRFQSNDGDSTYYAALTLRSHYDTPHFTVLTSDEALKKVRRRNRYTNDQLATLLLRSLEQELDSVTTLYFSPAGELYNLAIEAMPLWDNGGYTGDRWQMYRLSSTRCLAKPREDMPLHEATVYGGLLYEVPQEKTDWAAQQEEDEEPVIITQTQVLGETPVLPDSLHSSGGVPYLPGTLAEADEIAAQLQQHGIHPTLYTGTKGTEDSFRQLATHSSQILHIATHGFYWTEREAELTAKRKQLRFLSMYRKDENPEDRMLLGSGLLLTGANAALQGHELSPGHDDGILTAREISRTDLRSVHLVVLSACQTGLGTITGDGVFGLQRSFKKAGCQTLLMSLWKVDDRATAMLMENFYQRLTEGHTMQESLHMAQKTVRDYAPDAAKPDSHPFANPFFWGGFILLDALE